MRGAGATPPRWAADAWQLCTLCVAGAGGSAVGWSCAMSTLQPLCAGLLLLLLFDGRAAPACRSWQHRVQRWQTLWWSGCGTSSRRWNPAALRTGGVVWVRSSSRTPSPAQAPHCPAWHCKTHASMPSSWTKRCLQRQRSTKRHTLHPQRQASSSGGHAGAAAAGAAAEAGSGGSGARGGGSGRYTDAAGAHGNGGCRCCALHAPQAPCSLSLSLSACPLCTTCNVMQVAQQRTRSQQGTQGKLWCAAQPRWPQPQPEHQ